MEIVNVTVMWITVLNHFWRHGVRDAALPLDRDSQPHTQLLAEEFVPQASATLPAAPPRRELAQCSRCSRASLPRFSQARPCVWQVALSETAHSPWIGSTAWFLSCLAWGSLLLSGARGYSFAGSVRLPRRVSSCSSCAFCLWPLVRAFEAGSFLFAIFLLLFSVWTCRLMLVLCWRWRMPDLDIQLVRHKKTSSC